MALRKRMIANSTASIILAASTYGLGQTSAEALPKSGFAPIDGLKMYYEIHGSGEPLILLHGGVGATEMFAPIMPELAKNRQVIAADMQAHGRTADIVRPMSMEAMADDVAALIHYLKLERADVMGYSMGGEIALRLAIQHAEVVNRLVVVSAPYSHDGWYPEIQAGIAQMGPATAEPMKQTPMYQMYAQIAPHPADWPVLITKLGDMLSKDYDWSKDVAGIKAPTLLVVGDADAVKPAHVVQFFELLGGGKRDGGWDASGISNTRLAVLPGLTHYTIFSSPVLASTVIAFLDAPASGKP